MTNRVRILALLGSSPSVLTEFLYWVATATDWQVEAVEVWLTRGAPKASYESLLDQLGRDPYTRLAREIGATAAARLPAPLTIPTLEAGVVTGEERGGWCFHLLRDPAGRALDDVRDDAGTGVAMRALYDRIRELEDSEPLLVGLLSGGRKTMSSAMHAAYTLRARPQDALYHVLLTPEIEDDRELFKTYDFPTDEAAARSGVPRAAQLAASRVPFATASMLEHAPRGTWDQEWGRWPSGGAQVYLAPKALYLVAADGTWARLRLSDKLERALEALVLHPEGLNVDELLETLYGPTGDGEQLRKRRDSIRTLVKKLRAALSKLPMAVRLQVSPTTRRIDDVDHYRVARPDIVHVAQVRPKLAGDKERPEYLVG